MSGTDARTTERRAWVITGPTSGIGRRTALELAKRGTVVLVGRHADRLAGVSAEIEKKTGHPAPSVVCDLSDIVSTRHAAAEIAEMVLPWAGLVNNAGMVSAQDTRTAQGWNATFATNHLGPFSFTEALAPHLPDGARVVFLCSGVEDPERTPAVKAGYRGARFLSVEDSAHGRWLPGGSRHAGYDAYATAKQCALASVFALARETPRLCITAVEPGFTPGTGLVREAPAAVRFVLTYVLGPLAPFLRYWSTPKRAATVISRIVADVPARTGAYYDENGAPMRGSAMAQDPVFQDRVVAETRALLATVPPEGRPKLTS